MDPQTEGFKKKSKVPQTIQQLARSNIQQKPPTEAMISGKEMVEKGYISVKVPEMIQAKPGMSKKPRADFSTRSGVTLGANEGINYSQFNSLGAQRESNLTDSVKGFEGQPQISEEKAYKQLAHRTELIVDSVIEPQAEERTRAEDSLNLRETKADPKLP